MRKLFDPAHKPVGQDKRRSAAFYRKVFYVLLGLSIAFYIYRYVLYQSWISLELARRFMAALTMLMLAALYKWLARLLLRPKTDRIVAIILLLAFGTLVLVDLLNGAASSAAYINQPDFPVS